MQAKIVNSSWLAMLMCQCEDVEMWLAQADVMM
jgi:hypothetical protein